MPKVKWQDRTYEVPSFDELTFRETGMVKRVTGLRPLEWENAFQTGDPDMLLAILLVGLRRAGVAFDEDALLDSPAFGTIEFLGDEAPESPPDEAAKTVTGNGGANKKEKTPVGSGVPASSGSTD